MLKTLAVLCPLLLVATACAEETTTEEPIEVNYSELRWNGDPDDLPKRVGELVGKRVRIFGWYGGSEPYHEDYPNSNLRPTIAIPNWSGHCRDWMIIEPTKARTRDSSMFVEVVGTFSFQVPKYWPDEMYHIHDAEIREICDWREIFSEYYCIPEQLPLFLMGGFPRP